MEKLPAAVTAPIFFLVKLVVQLKLRIVALRLKKLRVTRINLQGWGTRRRDGLCLHITCSAAWTCFSLSLKKASHCPRDRLERENAIKSVAATAECNILQDNISPAECHILTITIFPI
jgi:hypothetical protein